MCFSIHFSNIRVRPHTGDLAILLSGGERGHSQVYPRAHFLRVFMGRLKVGPHRHRVNFTLKSFRDKLGLRSTLRLDTQDDSVSGSSADSALAGPGLLLTRRERTPSTDRSPQGRASPRGRGRSHERGQCSHQVLLWGTERTPNQGHTDAAACPQQDSHFAGPRPTQPRGFLQELSSSRAGSREEPPH